MLTLLALVTVLLTGCNDNDDDDNGDLLGGPSPKVSATEARTQAQRILNQRARAVQERDLPLFLRHLDASDQGLVARQRRYFRNLVQLPLQEFGYRVLPEQWPGQTLAEGWGDDVHIPRVQLTMQLEEYDAVPVKRTVGFVFSFSDGKATIVSDRTSTGKPLAEGTSAPWDLTAITVREEPGVLAVLDRGTRSSAETVTSVVRNGIAEINRALPFKWDDHVVVYHVTNPAVLGSFTDVPGGVITHLGAMTFPQYAEENSGQIASTRMLLMTSSIKAGQPFLGRITRHELTHVAVGKRDDGAPAWLSEGIAEYLGARELPADQRIIPTSALSRASTETGGMPSSTEFNGADQEWHYALSWMACDYIAQSRGEARLWELVDAMHDGGKGTKDRDQDSVLLRVLGIDNRELARRAAARIRNIYG